MTMPMVRLKEVAKFVNGKAFQPADWSEAGVPIIRIQNLNGLDKPFNYWAGSLNKEVRVQKNDLLLAWSGTPGTSFGAHIWGGGAAVLNQHIFRVDLNEKLVTKEWAKFVINAQLSTLIGLAHGGVGLKHVTKGMVEELEIPAPPLPEQRRIAAILDQTDALRAKRREALAQLDSLTQSIFIEMFGDPVTNPKGFTRKFLGEIIKFEGGSQPPASTFTDEEAPDTIRLVQIRDFKTDRFKTFIPKKLSRRFFEVDDVMIGRYGPPVFQILRGLSGSYNVALMKAVPREGITKDFVFHLLKEKRLHNFVVANSERTAGQSGVNLELLEKYEAYRPPIDLQREFVERISALNSVTIYMRESLVELDALFASLQHRAFRGDL